MQNEHETQDKDVFTLKRELATVVTQIRILKGKRDELSGKKRKRRPPKPLGPNPEIWPEQAMMILGMSRRKLATMLKTGQLADLHPYSIGILVGYKDPKLQAQRKKNYDRWKLKWSEYETWKVEQREKRAENALKMVDMFTSPQESE